MRYTAIYISGNLISQELIDKLDDDAYLGQRPADFGLESGTRTRQDIARAWTDANDYWKIFKRKLDALKDTERGTTETRSQWMIPFLGLLGYELNYIQQPEIINEKSYDISHRVTSRDGMPVMIVSAKDELDKKPEGVTRYRMSPHALLQEYLNVTEHTYGLVTNGKLLRLLRDNGRITRLTYLEFNLEKIFEDDLYADFALLYRLLHITRMPQSQGQAADSIIEKYYQQAIVAGTRIRTKLSEAVEDAIKVLANGLLQHPGNDELKQQLQTGRISGIEFYQTQLRLVYRLLFVMTIEERRLVYPEKATPEQQRLSDIYYRYYSVQHLRNLAGKKHLAQGLHHNLYIHLWQTFKLLEQPKYAEKLGMQALGSGLFESGRLRPLDSCKMYNKHLLQALWHLGYFYDEESKQTIRVNYGALNVEEFGSVYEGLLEYEAQVSEVNGQWQFVFVHSTERSKSGSHYTPEELVQPLIKHSLEYLIEDKLKEKQPVEALLSLKVCDVACGSGHILLSAARRIALEVARKKYLEEQPSPEHLRWATRQVINKCIYGVDKNPLAVELCKVALWLEAHNPGEPLNFLDHHIKCGDAIVGLAHREELDKGIADEAFKALPGDDKTIASAFLKRNKQERAQHTQTSFAFDADVKNEVLQLIEQYNLFKNLPERTPEEVALKERQYHKYEQDIHRIRLRQLADAQVAQFFIPKTDANKPAILTDAEYRSFLRQVNKGLSLLQSNTLAKAQVLANAKQFFHWFLEFPEVFNEGGFDCVLGNPPYLGDKKQKNVLGESFLEFIKYNYGVGINDLVVYFFLRIFTLLNKGKFLSLITTSSISQGDMRMGALERIISNGGNINFAVKSIRWPGIAKLNVALLSIKKGKLTVEKVSLNGKLEQKISSFLSATEDIGNPFDLKENERKIFTGYYFLGDGFLLTNEDAKRIINNDQKYKDVIFPFINGDDLNEFPDQRNSRSIINYFDWPLDEQYDLQKDTPMGRPYARDYQICIQIVEDLVKPERQRWMVDNEGKEIVGVHALRKPLPEKWWIYGESRPGMRKAISNLKNFFAVAQTTKHFNLVQIAATNAISQTAFVLATERFSEFVLVQSTFHFDWSVKYGNSKGDTFRYAPSKCFETFPFPKRLYDENKDELEQIGKWYHEHRRQLMLAMQLGLTKTYNAFHAREISSVVDSKTLQDLDKKAIEKQCGKEVWNLLNHLQRTPGTCSIEEAIAGIVQLRALHVQMDMAVLAAYGWQDIPLKHDFYEVDYLPENDRIRHTIHPDARKEVLKRLLALNHEIHEEEVAKEQARKIISKKVSKISKPTSSITQLLFPMRPETAYGSIYSVQDIVRITKLSTQTIKRWFNRLYNDGYEGISKEGTSNDQTLLLNFYGVHELIVIYDLRVKNNIPLTEILDARTWLKQRFGSNNNNSVFYPFTSQKVLETISKAGRQIIFTDEQTGDYITLGRGNSQLNFEFIKEILKRIVFDNDMVSRLYLSDSHTIAIDPRLAGGRPCTIQNEILIDSIKSVYKDSKNIGYIAKSYEISEAAVKDALEFENATVLN